MTQSIQAASSRVPKAPFHVRAMSNSSPSIARDWFLLRATLRICWLLSRQSKVWALSSLETFVQLVTGGSIRTASCWRAVLARVFLHFRLQVATPVPIYSFYFFYIRIDPAESSTLEWLSSKLTESVSLMYVTGLLLYAAIISALVGYLGSGLAKSVISSTKVRISRKIYKTKLFCQGSSQSWWDVHLLPPESCLDIQGETGRLTKHQNQ